MTEKQYLVKHCLNCANMKCICLGWGKQELQDCRGRPVSHTYGCNVFMPSKQVKFFLEFNPNYELITIDEAKVLSE